MESKGSVVLKINEEEFKFEHSESKNHFEALLESLNDVNQKTNEVLT